MTASGSSLFSPLLQRRWGDPWLPEAPDFWELVAYRQHQLHERCPQQVLLAEADPQQFLAGFLAALTTDCQLFLGSPTWGQQQWQQVQQQLSPDLCWGSVPPWPRPGESPTSPKGVIGIPTGGSSGKIKFALHTWRTLSASATAFQQHFQLSIVHAYCVLPLHHVSGLMQAVRSLGSGGQLQLQPFSQLRQGQRLPLPTPRCLSLVPTQLQALLDASTGDWAAWLRSFQVVLLGGAPPWPSLLQRARTLELPLALTYGATETASHVVALTPDEFLRGETSSGRALPHVAISAPLGAPGPIQITACSLALGYWPHPPATIPQPLTQPWATDDIGHLDAAGYLHMAGRSSTKIISGGENVFPEAVEVTLRTLPAIGDACVVGVNDRYWGQAVVAVITLTQPCSLLDISQQVRPLLSPSQRPKYWVQLPHLPRSGHDKISRAQVLDAVYDVLAEKS